MILPLVPRPIVVCRVKHAGACCVFEDPGQLRLKGLLVAVALALSDRVFLQGAKHLLKMLVAIRVPVRGPRQQDVKVLRDIPVVSGCELGSIVGPVGHFVLAGVASAGEHLRPGHL